MPFAATEMNLEIIILSEVIEKDKKIYDIIYMRNLKNELTYKTETDSQTQKTILCLPKGERKGQGVQIRNLILTDI